MRVLLCHAIDEHAARFCVHRGFIESNFDPLMVMLELKKVETLYACTPPDPLA